MAKPSTQPSKNVPVEARVGNTIQDNSQVRTAHSALSMHTSTGTHIRIFHNLVTNMVIAEKLEEDLPSKWVPIAEIDVLKRRSLIDAFSMALSVCSRHLGFDTVQ